MADRSLSRNPYTNRNAITCPEDFFGRVAELEFISRQILSHGSVSIIGERRVGKSSLLNALAFPDQRQCLGTDQEMCFVSVDCQYISGASEQEFLRYLLRRIARAAGVPRVEESREALADTAESCLAQRKRLVILMDEFDVLVHNPRMPPELFGVLRAWMSQYAISFVLASREGSTDLMAEAAGQGSPFLNVFQPLYLGPLRREEADELVRTPASMLEMEFTNDEVGWVFELAGQHPLLLQIACYHLFDLKCSGLKPDRAALEERFRFEATPHLMYLLQRLSEAENSALQDWLSAGSTGDRKAEGDLIRKGVLIPSNGGLRIFSSRLVDLLRQQQTQSSGLRRAWSSLIG